MKTGDNWNGWTVDSLIGEGSFGKVYKIVRTDFGHRYESALKVIRIPERETDILAARSEGLDDESIETYLYSKVDAIINEFTLLSELRGNSNIVSYEDHSVARLEDTIGWDIFIRMELLTPLSEYIYDTEFTTKDAIRVGIDICNALEVCRKNKIVHRDIKPENIFVSKTGDFKLGDFGIAREVEETAAMTQAGTAPYMAPEICRDLAYNSAVDMYSLGIVLYRLLNNDRLPFLPPYPVSIRHSDAKAANIKKMNGDDMPLPCNAGNKLGRIVLKASAYRPEDRYSSVAEMRDALESVQVTDEKLYPLPPADKISNEKIKQRKKARLKRGLLTTVITALVLAGTAGSALYFTDYYLKYYTPDYEKGHLSEEDAEYGFNGSWGYDESKLKKLKYKDAAVMIPSNWRRMLLEPESYGDRQTEGRFAEFDSESGERLAWVKIEYLGDYASIDELTSVLKDSGAALDLNGDPIDLPGCTEARRIERSENPDGETISAIVAVCNGRVYWIGGGAYGNNFSPTYFNKIIESCAFEEK